MLSSLVVSKKSATFVVVKPNGVLAHLVERNTGSVEVSGSSPLYSTNGGFSEKLSPLFVISL